MALGDSRHPAALDYLTRALERGISEDFREEVLLSIALLRLPAATEYLLGLLESQSKDVLPVLTALAVLRHDAKVRERVQTALANRNDANLLRVFTKKFQSE